MVQNVLAPSHQINKIINLRHDNEVIPKINSAVLIFDTYGLNQNELTNLLRITSTEKSKEAHKNEVQNTDFMQLYRDEDDKVIINVNIPKLREKDDDINCIAYFLSVTYEYQGIKNLNTKIILLVSEAYIFGTINKGKSLFEAIKLMPDNIENNTLLVVLKESAASTMDNIKGWLKDSDSLSNACNKYKKLINNWTDNIAPKIFILTDPKRNHLIFQETQKQLLQALDQIPPTKQIINILHSEHFPQCKSSLNEDLSEALRNIEKEKEDLVSVLSKRFNEFVQNQDQIIMISTESTQRRIFCLEEIRSQSRNVLSKSELLELNDRIKEFFLGEKYFYFINENIQEFTNKYGNFNTLLHKLKEAKLLENEDFINKSFTYIEDIISAISLYYYWNYCAKMTQGLFLEKSDINYSDIHHEISDIFKLQLSKSSIAKKILTSDDNYEIKKEIIDYCLNSLATRSTNQAKLEKVLSENLDNIVSRFVDYIRKSPMKIENCKISGFIPNLSLVLENKFDLSECSTIKLFGFSGIALDTSINEELKAKNLVLIAPVLYSTNKLKEERITIVLDGHIPNSGNKKDVAEQGYHGKPGFPGENAGSIYGYFSKEDISTNIEISMIGGRGYDGQDGGKGINGKNGEDASLSLFMGERHKGYSNEANLFDLGLVECAASFTEYHRDDGKAGENGKKGYRGGQGGKPGHSGKSAFEPNKPKMIKIDDNNGNHGSDGIPGEGGDGGLHGKAAKGTWLSFSCKISLHFTRFLEINLEKINFGMWSPHPKHYDSQKLRAAIGEEGEKVLIPASTASEKKIEIDKNIMKQEYIEFYNSFHVELDSLINHNFQQNNCEFNLVQELEDVQQNTFSPELPSCAFYTVVGFLMGVVATYGFFKIHNNNEADFLVIEN